ncbi:hypothetical protein [Streptomyces sp. NPDC058678]|uniref:hypothetical protein n=1 Tax=Streptomyces sp. NPDC058678 TaxID=3346595 RepID=UPI00365FBA85
MTITLTAELGHGTGGYLILGACNPTLVHRALEADRPIPAVRGPAPASALPATPPWHPTPSESARCLDDVAGRWQPSGRSRATPRRSDAVPQVRVLGDLRHAVDALSLGDP